MLTQDLYSVHIIGNRLIHTQFNQALRANTVSGMQKLPGSSNTIDNRSQKVLLIHFKQSNPNARNN